ncbi:MAG: alpha/beta fold hydrolase, partial [Gammaproteobacteria bacterium]
MPKICYFQKSIQLSIAVLALFLFAGLQSAVANGVDGLRTTDYFINHTSTEPFYAENNLDPNVILHVREVILAGRERSIANDGKALLLIHGATFPGYIAFDLNYKNVSLMRHFARLGWDTFALDLEGYGLSTRPPVMDSPEAFPESKAPIGSDVTVADVARVVDFILDLRGVDKVHLLGWSAGAALEAPLYAIQNPDKVAKLILYGTGYHEWSRTEEKARARAEQAHAQKNRYGTPIALVERELTKEEYFVPGVIDVYAKAHLESDPKSGELGGRIRAPYGRFINWSTP